MDPAGVVLRFLESVGRRSEAQFYLGLFRSLPKEQFAALSVDASVLAYAGEAVTLDLRFLAALGLFPVVVVGLVDPRHGARHAARVLRRLEHAGVRAELLERSPDMPGGAPPPAPPRIRSSSPLGPLEELSRRAAALLTEGVLPVLVLEREDLPQVADRFARVAGLLSLLRTRKLILLRRNGALRQRGAPVSLVNLTTEYEPLVASQELSPGERALLAGSRDLVCEQVAHKLTVAITSPLDLLRELFTERGAGTLLRRGSVIQRHRSFAGLDLPRLEALLASSFGRRPREALFQREVARVYLEQGYRGVAIVAATAMGSYLTKFAVEREAQGEGLGRDLWAELCADHPTLFWRARRGNPIADWYTRNCDGMARTGEWQVFWRGIPPAAIPAAIACALAQPEDFATPPTEPPAGESPAEPLDKSREESRDESRDELDDESRDESAG